MGDFAAAFQFILVLILRMSPLVNQSAMSNAMLIAPTKRRVTSKPSTTALSTGAAKADIDTLRSSGHYGLEAALRQRSTARSSDAV